MGLVNESRRAPGIQTSQSSPSQNSSGPPLKLRGLAVRNRGSGQRWAGSRDLITRELKTFLIY